MKIKQQRRWKRRTAAEQHQIACRVTGWVLWMLLLAGGAGFAAASAAGKYRMPSGSSSSAFAPLQKRADQAAAETLPGHGLFLQAYTAGTLADAFAAGGAYPLVPAHADGADGQRVSTASGGMRGRALWHWRKCCNAAFDLRACAVSFSVQIFEHDFVGDKEKIRRHTVSYGKGF